MDFQPEMTPVGFLRFGRLSRTVKCRTFSSPHQRDSAANSVLVNRFTSAAAFPSVVAGYQCVEAFT